MTGQMVPKRDLEEFRGGPFRGTGKERKMRAVVFNTNIDLIWNSQAIAQRKRTIVSIKVVIGNYEIRIKMQTFSNSKKNHMVIIINRPY